MNDHGQMTIQETRETDRGFITVLFCDICGKTIQFGPEPGAYEVLSRGNVYALHQASNLVGCSIIGAKVITEEDETVNDLLDNVDLSGLDDDGADY